MNRLKNLVSLMLNKKIQNKNDLRDEINIILNNHSLKNSFIESQLIISHSAKKLNYLDVKFDAKHANDFDKVAMVGEKKWEEKMSDLMGFFSSGEVKYFDILE